MTQTISYRTARKLKLAGIPQEADNYWYDRENASKSHDLFRVSDIYLGSSKFKQLYSAAFTDPEIDILLPAKISMPNGDFILTTRKIKENSFQASYDNEFLSPLYIEIANTAVEAKGRLLLWYTKFSKNLVLSGAEGAVLSEVEGKKGKK